MLTLTVDRKGLTPEGRDAIEPPPPSVRDRTRLLQRRTAARFAVRTLTPGTLQAGIPPAEPRRGCDGGGRQRRAWLWGHPPAHDAPHETRPLDQASLSVLLMATALLIGDSNVTLSFNK